MQIKCSEKFELFRAFLFDIRLYITGGLWTAFSNDVCRWIIEGTRQLTIRHVDFADWNTDMSINANVYVLTLIVCAVAGAALIAAGIVRTKKN